MYKKIKGRGGFRYLDGNNRFIAKDKIPKEELDKLDGVPSPMGGCIFCDKPAVYTRFINLQTIVLCEEHYYSQTVGQIAHKLRE